MARISTVIPINVETPWFTFRMTLDGARYILTARYNTRMDRWFLDIANAQNTPIIQSVPLLIERDLLSQYVTLSLPKGLLICGDDSGQGLQPTIQSWLNDHTLIYVNAA